MTVAERPGATIADLVGPAVLRRTSSPAASPTCAASATTRSARTRSLIPDLPGVADKNCRLPIGGAFKTVASAEIIFPTPFVKEDNDSTRLSVVRRRRQRVQELQRVECRAQLRASAGISFQWRAPVGPIVINLAKPIQNQQAATIPRMIQFPFGNTF